MSKYGLKYFNNSVLKIFRERWSPFLNQTLVHYWPKVNIYRQMTEVLFEYYVRLNINSYEYKVFK